MKFISLVNDVSTVVVEFEEVVGRFNYTCDVIPWVFLESGNHQGIQWPS